MDARKIKDFVGSLFAFLAIAFLLGLIFAPFRIFGVYANSLFGFFLAVLPVYLVIEAYYFVKDIPKRKSTRNKKKEKKNKIINILEWSFYVILIILFLLARNGSILQKECPESNEGNLNSDLTVKYFFNPFCPSCWRQEAVVQNTLENYGTSIKIERYDYRYCKKEWTRLGLMTVPGFLLEHGNGTEKFGSLSEGELATLICDKIKC